MAMSTLKLRLRVQALLLSSMQFICNAECCHQCLKLLPQFLFSPPVFKIVPPPLPATIVCTPVPKAVDTNCSTESRLKTNH